MARTNTSPQTGFLWVEEGERFEGMVVEVAPIIPTNRTYSFSVPASLTESIRLGHRVEVPIGRRNRLVRGFVVGLDRKEWQGTLQPIASVVDPTSYLDHKLIDLGRRISQHYGCPLGQTLKALTPEPVRRQSGMKTIRYARLALAIGEIVASGAPDHSGSPSGARCSRSSHTPDPTGFVVADHRNVTRHSAGNSKTRMGADHGAQGAPRRSGYPRTTCRAFVRNLTPSRTTLWSESTSGSTMAVSP